MASSSSPVGIGTSATGHYNISDQILDNIIIYDFYVSESDAAALNNKEDTFYGGMANITASIERLNTRISGDFRKTFISSLSIEAEGSIVDIDATLSAENNEFSVLKTFTAGVTAEEITTFAFVFDESVYAVGVGTEAAAGDADEAGYAGFEGKALATLHKKIRRVIKSNAIGVTLTSNDSRNLKILYIVLYWKALPLIA